MMKKKKERNMPEISTASLPDIIFMLLFFFMVVTVMRDNTAKINPDLPRTAYTDKIDPGQNKLSIYIQIEEKSNTELIQINEKLIRKEQMRNLFADYVAGKSASELEDIHVDLRVDKKVKMKIVNDLKTELRRSEIYNLNYILKKKVAS